MSLVEAVASLKHVLETCDTVLLALKNGGQESLDCPDSPTLLRDFNSLLSLIHGSATKVALTLKPPSPEYSASLAPLRDISIHVSRLGHCVSLFNPATHGATFVREVVAVAEDVVESIQPFIRVFLPLGNNTADKSSSYLIKVGAVHDIIEKSRGPNGLSMDNATAVRKRWTADASSLEDCFRELDEAITTESEVTNEDRDFDDGWDELGVRSGDKMSPKELERAKIVHTLLRLLTLLYKRISLELLASMPSPPIRTPPNAVLDEFLARSTSLLTAADELAASIYTPQDPEIITAELAALTSTVDRLQTSVQEFFLSDTTIGEHLATLGLSDESFAADKGGGKKDTRKWFETCFKQINKISQLLEGSLVENCAHGVT